MVVSKVVIGDNHTTKQRPMVSLVSGTRGRIANVLLEVARLLSSAFGYAIAIRIRIRIRILLASH